MKTTFLLALVSLLLIPASATLAQDTDAKQNLSKALSQLVSQDTYFTGGITEVEPEKEETGVGGIRLAVIVGGASNMKSFVGNFELGVSKDSQVAMVSTEDFPGLKVWLSGEELVCIQAHADKPFTPYPVTSTIGHLVNWKAIGQLVEKAPKVRVSSEDGETTIRVVLDKELLPVEPVEKQLAKQIGGTRVAAEFIGGPSLNPEVIDLAATFVLSSKNDLKSAEFAIQYNDPVKAMRSGVPKNVGGFGFGGFRVGGKANNAEQIIGKLVTIRYETMANPSERVVEFMKQAKLLAKK
jgi:hypothetical protein